MLVSEIQYDEKKAKVHEEAIASPTYKFIVCPSNEEYSHDNSEKIHQLEPIILSMQQQMERQAQILAEQTRKTREAFKQQELLRVVYAAREKELVERTEALLAKYESLQSQGNHEKVKSEPTGTGSLAIQPHQASTVTTIGQLKEWAADGEQGRTLARRAILEEGRIQAHRITMSFNQQILKKEREIETLKEELEAERVQVRAQQLKIERLRSAPDVFKWISGFVHRLFKRSPTQTREHRRVASQQG